MLATEDSTGASVDGNRTLLLQNNRDGKLLLETNNMVGGKYTIDQVFGSKKIDRSVIGFYLFLGLLLHFAEIVWYSRAIIKAISRLLMFAKLS